MEVDNRYRDNPNFGAYDDEGVDESLYSMNIPQDDLNQMDPFPSPKSTPLSHTHTTCVVSSETSPLSSVRRIMVSVLSHFLSPIILALSSMFCTSLVVSTACGYPWTKTKRSVSVQPTERFFAFA